MTARGADVDTALEASRLELRLGLGRAIGAVGKHLLRGGALVQEPIQLLAVVDGGVAHLVAPDQLVLSIHIHVVLVAEEALAVLLGPAGILVFLLAGAFSQASGVWPALTASFSSRVLRGLGTGTRVASTICPPRAM